MDGSLLFFVCRERSKHPMSMEKQPWSKGDQGWDHAFADCLLINRQRHHQRLLVVVAVVVVVVLGVGGYRLAEEHKVCSSSSR